MLVDDWKRQALVRVCPFVHCGGGGGGGGVCVCVFVCVCVCALWQCCTCDGGQG